MSYTLDGKVANQSVNLRLSGKVSCGKCCKLVPAPDQVTVLSHVTNQTFVCSSYIGSSHFVYETKSGTAVVYCSEYCRNKHNHRFRK